ncbi:M15 family metallopeptidase domain-containing protein [Streptomyces mirabilis]|uniref:hypothetical protein n=1 Tax=Streptomyces mirabilis TaxID=68239 RepID=UPI00364653EF
MTSCSCAVGDDQLQLRRLWHASALRPYGEGGFGEGAQQTVTEAVASGSVVEGVEVGGLQGRARGGRRYRGRGGGPGIRVLGDELAEQPGARTITTALVIVFGVPEHGRSGEFGDSGRHSVGPGARGEAPRATAEGEAVDISHSYATAWVSEHGAEYGLCQICRNEPWHYEIPWSASFAPFTAGNLNSTLRNNEAAHTWSGPGAC